MIGICLARRGPGNLPYRARATRLIPASTRASRAGDGVPPSRTFSRGHKPVSSRRNPHIA
jgi:hypothetical protein